LTKPIKITFQQGLLNLLTFIKSAHNVAECNKHDILKIKRHSQHNGFHQRKEIGKGKFGRKQSNRSGFGSHLSNYVGGFGPGAQKDLLLRSENGPDPEYKLQWTG